MDMMQWTTVISVSHYDDSHYFHPANSLSIALNLRVIIHVQWKRHRQ